MGIGRGIGGLLGLAIATAILVPALKNAENLVKVRSKIKRKRK